MELDEAYATAIYRVTFKNRIIDLQIGCLSQPLRQMLLIQDASKWAIITAQNPVSRSLSHPENTARQLELEKLLRRVHPVFPAVNIDPSNIWPTETACFILDISKAKAFVIANNYQQNAFVYGTNEAVPYLIWCK